MESERKTIFIVDDNRSNLVVGSDALSGSYRVFTFISGGKLFKMLEKLVPDLILLDVDMPEMDGYEVLKRLKSDSKTADIPVIFLTALSSTELEHSRISTDTVYYISKPFTPPMLIKSVERHLR